VSDAPPAIALESENVSETELVTSDWLRAVIQQIKEAGVTPTQKGFVTVMGCRLSGLPRFPAAVALLAQVQAQAKRAPGRGETAGAQ
jgi:hypothetical protein